MVGLVGFEPTASASRTQRSTKLSHSPFFVPYRTRQFSPQGKLCGEFRLLPRPVAAATELSHSPMNYWTVLARGFVRGKGRG